MERPEGYPQLDDATCTEPEPSSSTSTSTSFFGTKNDISLLESGLLGRNDSEIDDSYYRLQSKLGTPVDPMLLALSEFFSELYFSRSELLKKILPCGNDKLSIEVPNKLGMVLAQVKPEQTKMVRTKQRSLSIGSPRDFKGVKSEMKLERFKVRTIDVDDGVSKTRLGRFKIKTIDVDDGVEQQGGSK